MGKSDLQMVCVLPWSGMDEDWQMWSMKFHMDGVYKGYDSIMDGTVTLPTADKLLKEKDEEVTKAGQIMIKLNQAGYVDLMLLMSNVISFNLVKEHNGNLYYYRFGSRTCACGRHVDEV